MPKTKNPDLGLGNPIKFYNDTVTLRFSERDHIYYLVGPNGELEPLDGVTSVCKIINAAFVLMPWACKVMYEKILRTMPHTEDFAGDYTDSILWTEFEELIKKGKSAHKEELWDAGNVGLLAHAWIEDSIRWAIAKTGGIVKELTPKVPEDERATKCGQAAFEWMKLHHVRFLNTEHKVYSRQYKYAGTMDGKALVNACDKPNCCGRYSLFTNQLSIIDWKTSNQFKAEYLYQTAAYQAAEMEEFGEQIGARWILRLGKEDGKFEPWYATNFEEDFEAFRLCLTLSRQHHKIERRIADNKKELTQIKKRLKKETE